MNVRACLFGGDGTGADSIQAIVRSLQVRGPARAAIYGVQSLTGDALNIVEHEIAEITSRELEFDVGGMLVAAWQTHRRLVAAAHATLDNPGQTEIVSLLTHEITWTHQPTVDLLVDGVTVNTLVFELTVQFEVEGLVAVVRNGCLESLRGGDCVIATTLTLEGRTILPRREVRFEDLRVLVPLGQPIPLTSRARTR